MRKKLFFISVIILILGINLIGYAAQGAEPSFERMAESIAKLLVAGRGVIAEQQEVINTHNAKVGERVSADEPKSFKGLVPAIFGRLMGTKFKLDTGVNIKQTTLGKNKSGVRNVYNEPDGWETTQLIAFSDEAYPRNKGFGEIVEKDGEKLYRYIYPMYIEWSCLQCHGNPKDSPTNDGKDITGRQMEGYTVGELRGGISVIIPLKTSER